MIGVLILLLVGGCKKDESTGSAKEGDTTETAASAEPGPGARLNRRLSHSAYDNTVTHGLRERLGSGLRAG